MSTAAPAAPIAINPKLIVPFVNAVRNVFSTMVHVPTTIDRPMVKGSPAPAAPSYDVSSIIGFSGDIIGSMVLSFQYSAAAKLVEAFAQMPLEVTSPDFADAIGELANMVAGAAKRDIGGNASITCPNVILGAGHTVARLSDVPCLIIPCKTPVGDFAVEISIKSVQK